ncbi:cupin domain-containing protein [Nocardioides sp. LMS-CY]|uniref:cupin domain-containing protein n=1 Tax=Nocardioides sp. (strain LMS-CY) TaxID=2840457 RepID=UPI001C0034F5|nr:cupin domain-containing protein [Nocardioides sp. LMS-CY]QWF20492.1 cupin domain-containing protein [Nocardioides sp. LMS-CY]
MAYHVSRAAERKWVDVPGFPGLRQALMAGEVHGSHHMEIALYELEPGASLGWNRSPFEESWFVTEGSGRVALAGLEYELGIGDYGVTPVAVANSLTAGEAGLSWFSARSPKPPTFEGARSHISAQPVTGEFLGRPSETDPRHRYVGHFDEADMAPYHDLNMPGYHGPCIKNISIRMMADELLGAQHHTMFMASIDAKSGPGKAAKIHYHPFEEIYYFVGGGMRGWLDGNEEVTETGDLVWVSSGGTHGFINESDEPAKWIEVQSPVPPPAHAFYFPDDWRALPEES